MRLPSSLRIPAAFSALAVALALVALCTADARGAFEGRSGGIVYQRTTGTFKDVGDITFKGGIYFRRSAKSKEIRLTNGLTDASPVFAPDGRTVAFSRRLPEPNPKSRAALYVVGVNGSGLRRVTSDEVTTAKQPAFSPDGEWIYFSGNDSNTPSGREIFRVPSVGGEAEQLTSVGRALEPTASPDGRKIAFAMASKGRRSDIYVMAADGRAIRPLVSTPESERSPSYSPDGRLLTFIRTGRVAVSGSNGKKSRVVTTRPDSDCQGTGYSCFSPTFSPDGRRVLYLESSGEFFLINSILLSGRALRVYIQTSTYDDGEGDSVSSPDWQPLTSK